MDIVVYASTEAPIEEIASDLSAHGVVVFAVGISGEFPLLGKSLDDELTKDGGRSADIIHGQAGVDGEGWFDYFVYGEIAGFNIDTAPNLVGKALAEWRKDGEPPRSKAKM